MTGFDDPLVGFDGPIGFDGVPPVTSLPSWPTLIIEAAFASDPLATTPVWTDITAYGQNFLSQRGRSFELDDVEAGTLDLTLKNLDRRFDPTYTSGPYYGQLTVNRRTRIRVMYNGITYPLYDGFLDALAQQTADQSNRNASATLTATDAFKWLAKNELTPVGPATVGDATYGVVGTARVGGQISFPVDAEKGGDRVNTILDLWPFPASMRDVDDGLTLLERDGIPISTRALDPSETAIAYLRRIRDSEDGRFHVSADGKITFWARNHWQSTPTQTTSQHTFSDTPTGSESGYQSITMDPADDRYIRNVIERTETDWATPIVAQSPGSIGTYGPIPDSRKIVSRYKADVLAQVNWLLLKYKGPKVRVSSITISPRRDPAVLFPLVLGLEVGDRITVKRKIAAVGASFSQQYWIERIQHEVDAHLTWLTTWQLAPADTTTY